MLRPAVRAIVATRSQIVLGLAVVITLLCGFALVGAAVDDRKITANLAVAQAQVLEGSTFARTLVRFTAASGETVVPELGVAYPRGLQPGDTVAVEYDVTHPDRVRVAARSAFTNAWPLLGVMGLTWVLLLPLARHLRRP